MRQLSQNYKTGALELQDVAPPMLRPGGVLVRSAFSVVSPGTEGMKVREARMGYLEKAMARPDQMKKVVETARQQGIAATFRKVVNKLDSLTPLGYSLAGTVVAVGTGCGEFHVGQRVACAGAGLANHAEVNFIPKNLVVAVPDAVGMDAAAFATMGAIALHGFRQGDLRLGETACVIGLGLVGQILVQLLRASGIAVVGVDPVDERCRLAERPDGGRRTGLRLSDGGHAAQHPSGTGCRSGTGPWPDRGGRQVPSGSPLCRLFPQGDRIPLLALLRTGAL